MWTPDFADVILTEPEDWREGFNRTAWIQSLPAREIIGYQQRRRYAVFWHVHARLYLGAESIVSVTYPRARWEHWRQVRGTCWTVYRPVFEIRTAQTLARIKRMLREHADNLMRQPLYDWGQLMDFLLHEQSGSPLSRWLRRFDRGLRRRVCSTGVRYVFDSMVQQFHELGEESPFKVRWTHEGEEIALQLTPPAIYANLPRYFRRIRSWREEAV